MRVLGIIVEYNPFHVGHLHHLASSIELIKPDYVVGVMSGNFVQRGEPAIVDKFARTEMALKAGVDVVFEIPTIYAIQDASGFAFGSIGMLDSTNVVTDIVFGSETNDIESLYKIADIILNEPLIYQEYLKKYLKLGYSFPNARRFALRDFIPELDTEGIKHSNNILGVEYIVSLKRLRSKMKAHTIKRIGSRYNEERLTSVPSATAIRKAILKGQNPSGLPDFSLKILKREFRNGRGPIFMEDLFEMMRFKILMLSREGMENLYGFNEGISKRMIDGLDIQNMDGFLRAVKTKRFTLTRIKRRILYALFDIEREFVLDSNDYGPQYIRVLGFRKKARELLRKISDNSKIPLVTNVSRFDRSVEKRNMNIPLAKKQMELDIKATDFYSLLFKKESERSLHRDYRKPVIEE